LRTYTGKFGVQVLIVFSGAALLVLPALVGQRLIDDGVLRGDRGVILSMGAVLGVVALVQAGVAYTERVFSARFAEELVLRLRRDLLAHLDQQALGFFAYARPGAVVARIHGDVDGVRQLVAGAIPGAMSAVATLAFSGGALLVLEWRAALAVLILVPVIYTMAESVAPRMRDVSHRELAAYSGWRRGGAVHAGRG
jgi:ATP-binding cassette subfamily B protein